MMKILVIATQLPPYIGSGNIRMLNYINHLSRLGNKVDVIGVDYPKDAIAYDPNLENSFDQDINVYRINPGFFYKFFYRKKSNISSSVKKGANISLNKSIKARINRFIKGNLVIPDAFLQWIIPAYKYAVKLHLKNNYDIVFSAHETPSSHIVAYLLKQKFSGIRWVGYWSDPWNGDSLRNNRAILKKYIEEKIERKIVESVDRLLFTTKKTRNFYLNKYNLDSNNVSIVFRGYNKQQYADIISRKDINLKGLDSNKINVVYIGTIYHHLRDINPLYEALNLLRNSDIDLYNNLNIIFIGQFDDDSDQRKLREHSNVNIYPLVPYEQALHYTVKADVLLLYGNKKSTQVPGKVYEYLGSPAIILTLLGDLNDELKDIMEDAEKGPVILNDKKELYIALKKLIKDYMDNNLNKNWMSPVEKYEWENVSKDLEMKLMS